MNAALETLYKRRSIRQYTGQPVSEELMTELLKAAMAAPSACNSQPWEFVAVTEPAAMERLREALRYGRYNAPAAIAVCANPALALNSCARLFWQQDCSAALQNILIAATSLGLGSVWIGVYPVQYLIDAVRVALELPEEVTPLGVGYIGYPAEEKPPRTQFDERRVHWQTYRKTES
ncbi:MAG: nitroreductase family protein [Anaerolineae bacterium]|nr:nitroreductase family protein [Anaerolineae bacterium]